MKILILGATGLVGRELLSQALRNESVERVVALSRRPLLSHPKLETQIVNFENLDPHASWWKVDAIICALGTTIKAAGSQEKFYRVDHDYPLIAARHGQAHGVGTFVLNSAMGADSHSRFFYNKVKGQLEEDLKTLNFRSLSFVRPGLIGGQREEFRLAEEIAKVTTRILQPLLPKRWNINPPENIARSLLEAALQSQPGVHIIESEKILMVTPPRLERGSIV